MRPAWMFVRVPKRAWAELGKPAGTLAIHPLSEGLDTLRIFDTKTIAYLDLTGSGIETIAHVRENGRIVLMFCAFEGAPRVLRLHGKGKVVEEQDPKFVALRALFLDRVRQRQSPNTALADCDDGPPDSTRAIILIELTRISTSCGYGVPLFSYQGERTSLMRGRGTKAWMALGCIVETILRSVLTVCRVSKLKACVE